MTATERQHLPVMVNTKSSVTWAAAAPFGAEVTHV